MRWVRHSATKGNWAVSNKTDLFIKEIHALYKKYNLAISLEDKASAFEIVPYELESYYKLSTAVLHPAVEHKEVNLENSIQLGDLK